MNKCGTNAGYQKHCVEKTTKCDPCKKAHSKYLKKYTEKNAINLKEKRKTKYLEKQDYFIEQSRIYRKNNPNKSRNYQKQYRQINPESKRSSERRRRVLKRKGIFEVYKESEVLNLYGTKCHICNIEINMLASRLAGIGDWEQGLHIDHLMPISKGGSDTLDNVRPAHAICNLKKHAKPLSK